DNRDVQVRLQQEIDEVLGGRKIAAEDRDRLPYLRAVLEEVLRLYPPAWGVGRRSLSERELGGYKVPARAIMGLHQYSSHRNPKVWSEPERFDPDRWLDGRPASVPRGAFFPFADGPRRCIGEHFARAEALIATATIVQR